MGGRGGSSSGGAGGGAGQSGVNYSACTFVGGITRVVVAKRDAQRNLCVVLVLAYNLAGTNPYNITLPPNVSVEFAYAMPATADCRVRVPPAGSLAAVAGSGTVALPATPIPTVNLDVTLSFTPNDASVPGLAAMEQLVATGLLAPPTCL